MIELWNALLFQPMLNLLVIFYTVLFHNFGVAIIGFTILIRLLTWPLTRRQWESTKKMSALQPRMQELQKKYARDKRRLGEEQMKLYREMKINPVGCLWPTLIQFPIWIALYQSLINALASSPDALFRLSQHLYSIPLINESIPLSEQFLWINLAQPDRSLILPVLVGASLWVQQKMTAMPATDPRQKSMNNMMLWMMPMIFSIFALQFPSGLAVYWLTFNFIGIVMQYFIGGWGGLSPSRAPQSLVPQLQKGEEDATTGVQREERGGSPTPGSGRAGSGRRRSRSSRRQ